ncbi:VanW family protein [Streptomyces noursei]|uniref:VanW family protein n=1 Tax=Streptomyces noursei TaxID=1971 RepID=UPI0035DDE089
MSDSDTPEKRGPAGDSRRIYPVLLVAGAVALGAGGLYLAGVLAGNDEISPGTRVQGTDIGGLSKNEAQKVLEVKLAKVASAPLAVNIGDQEKKLDPNAIGLSLDVAGTTARAAQTGWDPVTVISRLFSSSGGDVDPVIRMDEGKARAALQKLADTTDRKVREASITFDKGKPKNTPSHSGKSLDVDEALGALRSAYLASAEGPIKLPVTVTQPQIDLNEIERAMKEFAHPAMSAPITLTTGDKHVQISPSVFGKHLTLKAGDGKRLAPRLNGAALLNDPAVARPLGEAVGGATEAKLRLDGNRVAVAADGKAGRGVTEKTLTKAVLPLLTMPKHGRSAEVATETIEPKVTRKNIEKLGITEQVSSFTVKFEPAAYRKINIGRAVELINGSVILPDETWSFNRTVGERTKENGFVDGTIINNGQYQKASGGGVSAVATTVFNAVFFAGLKPVEHGAHSFYIERYPQGREATVAWDSLDLKFLNDSGKALYIQAKATDTSVTVTFLGTKKYENVSAEAGPRTNVKPPGSRSGTGTSCEPQSPMEGFDINVDRLFHQGGKVVKRETFTTRYSPRDTVTCS